MASNDREKQVRYEVELRIVEVTRTDVVNSYEKTVVSSSERELEIELIQVRGKELPAILERVKKNIDLIAEDN
jgi:ABC-type uncharacterized transport system YnjBCD substrate-binding protein